MGKGVEKLMADYVEFLQEVYHKNNQDPPIARKALEIARHFNLRAKNAAWATDALLNQDKMPKRMGRHAPEAERESKFADHLYRWQRVEQVHTNGLSLEKAYAQVADEIHMEPPSVKYSHLKIRKMVADTGMKPNTRAK